MTRAILIAIALAAIPALGAAQENICGVQETVLGCHDRLAAELVEAVTAKQSAASGSAERALQEKATGPNVGAGLAQSAIRDFLPRFAGSLLASDPANDLRAFDLRFNTPLGAASGARLAFQGGVTLHAAEVFVPLVDSIPGSIRKASRERLSGELEDGDDATALVALNVESRSLGRAFAYHQRDADSLTAALADSATKLLGGEPPIVKEFEDEFVEKLGDTLSILPSRRTDPSCIIADVAIPTPRKLSALLVGCLTPEVRRELGAMLTEITRFGVRRQVTLTGLLESAGFDRLAQLVNNQPQLSLSAEYRSRVATVGPNEWAGRIRYEQGFANMNALRRFCGGTVRLPCVQRYTESASTRRGLARADRLWIEGEVRYRPEYRIALPDDSVALTLKSGVGLAVSGGYGAYMGSVTADGQERDRIDLHLSYDRADGADLRQSRFLAALFYTLRINDNASGVVGLAWANRAEFVAGADRRLHANLGLSYKFNRGASKG